MSKSAPIKNKPSSFTCPVVENLIIFAEVASPGESFCSNEMINAEGRNKWPMLIISPIPKTLKSGLAENECRTTWANIQLETYSALYRPHITK